MKFTIQVYTYDFTYVYAIIHAYINILSFTLLTNPPS